MIRKCQPPPEQRRYWCFVEEKNSVSRSMEARNGRIDPR
jgi:hypothetical protein